MLGVGITSSNEKVFEELARAYGEPTRHYHSAEHVADCLHHLAESPVEPERPAELEIALWFHDAVYDARRADNEQLSADWAETFLRREGAPADVGRRVASLILATRHQTTALEGDEALIVDIDLAILGQPPDKFAAYDDAIRREYDWVPWSTYRRARGDILKGFLDREHIYNHASNRGLREDQARRNLRAAIDRLSAAL